MSDYSYNAGYGYDGLPMGQPSATSSTFSETREEEEHASPVVLAASDNIIGMVVVPAISAITSVNHSPPAPLSLTALMASAVSPATPTVNETVSPETPTVNELPAASSVEVSMATMEPGTPPALKVMVIHGVAMTPPAWRKAAARDAKKSDEDSLSDSSLDCWAGTLSWLRDQEKESADKQKRKAEEHAEESKKRRATKGYSPALVIDIGGVPLEQVDCERQVKPLRLLLRLLLRHNGTTT
jgi:hypothetical protein